MLARTVASSRFLILVAVVGTFLSDLLLMWIDPRIRFESRR